MNPDTNDSGFNPHRCAEARLVQYSLAVPEPATDITRAMHELHVYQVELEMQNEALRAARDQAETALARFTDLYDFAPVGYFTLRRDGTIRQLNFVGARLLGWTRSQVRNRHFASFITEDGRQGFADFMARVLVSPTQQVCEVTFLPTAERPAVFAQIESSSAETGDECRLVVTDITARKQAEELLIAAKTEAERANKAKSRFMAAASHDLRQPLSALGLYVNVIGSKLGADDAMLVANMNDCVASLREMLNDMLDLSKLEAGAVKPKISDFAVAAFIDKIISSHAPEARLKDLRLGSRPTRVFARTDPMLFGRMLGNLVDNAICYTARGGVLVGCRRRQGAMWLEVWDTGIGFPAEKSEEIFEEFKQLGDVSRGKGSGLGLAIVAKTAALLGLRIRVHSRLGRGSMFAIELPLGEAVLAPAPHEVTQRSLRIALVEDNADVAQALAYSLDASGHQVVVAATGNELLLRLGGHAPDIVISDYRLGGGENGLEVIASVRAACGDGLPALIITGDTDPALMSGMVDADIRLLHKPLEFEALRACIAELTAV